MYLALLVALDPSSGARAVMPEAVALARSTDARITPRQVEASAQEALDTAEGIDAGDLVQAGWGTTLPVPRPILALCETGA